MVAWRGTYHAIIGRPGYAKFMAVPNYTYLKLKMSGPSGVITVDTSYEHAYDCDVECMENAEAVEESAILVARDDFSKEIPNPKQHAGNFKPAKDTKAIPLDLSHTDGKALTISATLEPK